MDDVKSGWSQSRHLLACLAILSLASLLGCRGSTPELTLGPDKVDADAPTEFTETESGLRYRIRRQGTGRRPVSTDVVTVHYKGWLDDGTEFDSSYKRGTPTSFPLTGVIPGWTEGIPLVEEKGMIELEVPYQLAYGERGMPPKIPPRSRLHFLVELVEVR